MWKKKILKNEKNKVFKNLDKEEIITKNKFKTKAKFQKEVINQLKNVEQEEKINPIKK